MKITLDRYSHSEAGTFGKLKLETTILETVEQDWENNEPNKSCIPNGTYDIEPYNSPKYGSCYVLVNHELGVGKYQGDAKRYACLFHSANLASQLEGCIAPGLSLIFLRGSLGVGSSKAAMRVLSKFLSEGAHTLEIRNNFPSFQEK